MSQIISIILILALVGFLSADPIQRPCPTDEKILENLGILAIVCNSQTLLFDCAPGLIQNKHTEFTAAWSKIASITKLFLEASYPDACDHTNSATNSEISLNEDQDFEKVFGNVFRYLDMKSKISEKEYLTYTDPKIFQKLENKSEELEACFENSRDLFNIQPQDPELHFCSYEFDEGIDCAKKLFENDPDEPLLGLINFIEYFVIEFDCDAFFRDAVKYSMGLAVYNGVTGSYTGTTRRTFFQGFLDSANGFTTYKLQ